MRSPWFLLGCVVLSGLFGAGSVWRWRESTAALRGAETDAERLQMELRGKLNESHFEALRLNALYATILAACPQGRSAVHAKIEETEGRLRVVNDEIISTDAALARLEGRPPRFVQAREPAPTIDSVRITLRPSQVPGPELVMLPPATPEGPCPIP
jgi:hypothetical protein